MSGFLLDTNCISELVRSKPEPRVLDWMEAADESLLYLSVLTLGEIRKGVAQLPQGKRRTHLETWLELELRARFSGKILPIINPATWTISNQLKANNFVQNDTTSQISARDASLCFRRTHLTFW